MGFRIFPYNIDYYIVGGLKRANSGEVKRKRGRPALVSDVKYELNVMKYYSTMWREQRCLQSDYQIM